jgi:hypothetical protein
LADSALPWPVSKYMTLSPTGPRFSASAPRAPRRAAPAITPKLRLAASVPAIDWNTGRPARPARSRHRVVTWASTQDCVGISKRWRIRSSSMRSSRTTLRHAVGRRVDADHRVAAP